MDWFGKINRDVELVVANIFGDNFVLAIAIIMVDQKMMICFFVILNRIDLVAPNFRLHPSFFQTLNRQGS